MENNTLWQTKLAARIHDPAEKALVLLRDPAGHENGTSRVLRRLLGLDQLSAEQLDPDNADALTAVLFKKGLPLPIYQHVQRADWWAAAADRPQWPMEQITVTTKKGQEKAFKVADWAQVRWTKQPVLIHPLTGDTLDLHDLTDTEIDDIKQRSFEHFSSLLVKLGAKDEQSQDLRKTLLSYWRFGPELDDEQDNGRLGVLWPLLPADTRVPDHSIWDHLDLTSAFAGAFATDPDGEAALLALSIGPVQDFIAAARSSSDLWAGSHLLSRLAWEAMKPVCEALGPDAILFPRLRGIPQVDLWLRDEMHLPDTMFTNCVWRKGGTDANPLFSAALPNRFVAVVPASQARKIAEQVETAVRTWLFDTGEDVVSRLLKEAGLDVETALPYEQMKEQLQGFPEVHWAAVPFTLIKPRNQQRQTELDTSALSAAMAPFFGAAAGEECGFLKEPAWQVLKEEIEWGDGTTFFAPNPGVLYPAVYDLAERVMAAAKSVRPFQQSTQQGWRCSLTGEAEWLTTDREQLKSSYRQQTDTLWARISQNKPAWAKKGEHLSALPAIKRLWPTLFAEEVGKATGNKAQRFVVSTHTMALAHQLDQWLERGGQTAEGLSFELERYRTERVALPRKLLLRHMNNPALADAKRLPALLEAVMQDEEISEDKLKNIKDKLRQTLGNAQSPKPRLETYYSLLMMDGDRMGAILSGDEETGTAIPYRDGFHPQVQKGFGKHAAKQPRIRQYGEQKRPPSPNRHLAVSGALNDFSQTVVRHVVESERLGRVIYAGGDDVLAMLPVADLLPCMQRLRHAYSGTLPEDEALDWGELKKTPKGLHCKNGFAFLDGRLMRMMGRHATASTGAVIAHHQAPLGAVMRELRAAEKRAKEEGGRNAFHICIVKRSGGTLRLTAKWGEPLTLLDELRDFLTQEGVSRRAVYHSLAWLDAQALPEENPAMLETLLAYQFSRQIDGKAKNKDDLKNHAPKLAQRLIAQAKDKNQPIKWLRNFLSVAEFLARETRQGENS
ncbi:MAG: type III-B CRISPR-associated protein Cas10/Cmr2 [Thiohalomonadaceae bacterium]